MTKQPAHRPENRFPEAQRVMVTCELNQCAYCGSELTPRTTWHMQKTVQTLQGPVRVIGKSKECRNPACGHFGHCYLASGVLGISLPYSTYGLDVLALIGWEYHQHHRQFKELQQQLNERGVVVSERTVGRLYRQFLALVGALEGRRRAEVLVGTRQHGGVIWAVDALQPEAGLPSLYVLSEVITATPVSAILLSTPDAASVQAWLAPYQDMAPVLATLSDGEEAIIHALKQTWPTAPHQRCQLHLLNNLTTAIDPYESRLRQDLRESLRSLPAVPTHDVGDGPDAPPFCANGA